MFPQIQCGRRHAAIRSPVLQMKYVSFRKVKGLAQGHKLLGRDVIPGLCEPCATGEPVD